MNSVLNKPIVLKLNAAWQVNCQRTVAEALVDMNGGRDGSPPALGLDLEYERNEDGSWDFATLRYANPVPWCEWVKLPIRDFDFVVHSPTLTVRVPTVIVAPNYSRPRFTSPRFNADGVFARDGGRCQFSGELVPRHEGNLDHVVPVSRGGANTWENVVWTRRSTNSLKADRLPHEAGLRLIRRPKAPPLMPIAATLPVRHRDWAHFLTR